MPDDLLVDAQALREQVRAKYRDVALDPHQTFHFHTGRRLAARCDYDAAAVGALPDLAVESFAGVGNRSRCAGSSPASGSSTSVRARGSIRSSPPARWDRAGTWSGWT